MNCTTCGRNLQPDGRTCAKRLADGGICTDDGGEQSLEREARRALLDLVRGLEVHRCIDGDATVSQLAKRGADLVNDARKVRALDVEELRLAAERVANTLAERDALERACSALRLERDSLARELEAAKCYGAADQLTAVVRLQIQQRDNLDRLAERLAHVLAPMVRAKVADAHALAPCEFCKHPRVAHQCSGARGTWSGACDDCGTCAAYVEAPAK